MYNNLPLDHQHIDDIELEPDLHEVAGLISTGKDEDGDIEWMGDKKCWDEYERISAEHQDQCSGCAYCEA